MTSSSVHCRETPFRWLIVKEGYSKVQMPRNVWAIVHTLLISSCHTICSCDAQTLQRRRTIVDSTLNNHD